MRAALIRILPVCLVAAAASYDHAESAATQPSPVSSVQPAKVVGDLHSITLPQVPQPDLPEGPGKGAFMISCTICHTLRYVTMQPPFSRQAWLAEVDKMRKTYGALMTDEQAAQCVDYVVTIRGAQPESPKR